LSLRIALTAAARNDELPLASATVICDVHHRVRRAFAA
jgi:hypothetical protein